MGRTGLAKLFLCASGTVLGAMCRPCGAAVHEVGDIASLAISDGDAVRAAGTATPTELPAVATPTFHLDASQADGWTVDANGVRRIPSLVGTRFLVSQKGKYIHDLSKRDPDGVLWDANDYWTLEQPQLATDDALGVPVLDFGALGSRQAMLFDFEADVAAGVIRPTNALQNVGTVIAVWRQAGGALLGGGVGFNNGGECNGQMWVRGYSFVAADATPRSERTLAPDATSPLLWCTGNIGGGLNNVAFNPAVNGIARENGLPTIPWRTSRAPGWTVTALLPTNSLGCANGLGLGIIRQNQSALSGGLKVAELVVYGEVLDVFRVQQVEAYLAKKWLGRHAYGTDGKARVGSLSNTAYAKTNAGTRTMLDVPAGATLELGEIAAGRGLGASIEKTGAGTLDVSGLRDFPGALTVSSGTLRLGGRPTPTEIPVAPFLHFDVSAPSAFTTEATAAGGRAVTRLENLAGTTYQGAPIAAVAGTYQGNPPPQLVASPFTAADGTPRPAVDLLSGRSFGTSAAASGAFFRFVNATNDEEVVRVYGLTTVLAVVAPGDGGGTLLGNVAGCAADPASASATGCYFDRDQGQLASWKSFAAPLLGTRPFPHTHPTLTPTNGLVMIDGVVRDVRAGYVRRGFQVVALQVPASAVDALGASFNPAYAGGFRFVEVALYNRPLSEEQIRDVQAYLSAKWMGRALPGYSPVGEAAHVPSVQDLTVASGAAIDVPAGRTARVRLADFSTAFAKTGAGTLEVENPDGLVLSGVKVLGGDLRYVPETDFDAAKGYARAPSLHLDANETNRMETFVSGDEVRVREWTGFGGGVSAANGDNDAPTLCVGAFTNRQERVLNAVSFGDFRSNRRADLQRPLHGVRAAYVVAARGALSGGHVGVLLGTAPAFCSGDGNGNVATDVADFYYGTDNNGYPSYPFTARTDHGTSVRFGCGPVVYCTNGVPTEVGAPQLVAAPADGRDFQLYEVHLPVGAHVSALCGQGNDYLMSGGWRYGEILLYERALTDRERIATRNYLAKKWLGKTDGELEPLPDAPEVPAPFVLANWEVVNGAAVAVEAAETRAWGRVTGAGDFTKAGAGTLSVNDVAGFTGTVTVAEGALRLAFAPPPEEPAMPDAEAGGLVLHLDASRADTLTLHDAGGVRYVNEWRSLTDNGVRAVPRAADKAVLQPQADLLDAMPAVKMRDKDAAMTFLDAAGARVSVSNVASALWVVGSQEGGGFLLGNEVANPVTSRRDNWYRGDAAVGGDYGGAAADFLLYAGAADGVRTAEFHVNDTRYASAFGNEPKAEKTPVEAGLSGGWDFVSARVHTDTYAGRVSADALALCAAAPGRSGRQRLAELLVYTNELTAAELRRAGYALRAKWGLENWQRACRNEAQVHVVAGATLDLGGANQYLKALGGAGRVVNGDVAAKGLVAAPDGALTVEGRFTAADGFSVDLSALPAGLTGDRTILVAGGGVSGARAIRQAQVVCGAYPDARLLVRGNCVVARLRKPGGMILVR